MEILIRYTSLLSMVVSINNHIKTLPKNKETEAQCSDLKKLYSFVLCNLLGVYKFLYTDSVKYSSKAAKIKRCEFEREITTIENLIQNYQSRLGIKE